MCYPPGVCWEANLEVSEMIVGGFKVIRTDCRTGWLIYDAAGRHVATSRSWAGVVAACGVKV